MDKESCCKRQRECWKHSERLELITRVLNLFQTFSASYKHQGEEEDDNINLQTDEMTLNTQ